MPGRNGHEWEVIRGRAVTSWLIWSILNARLFDDIYILPSKWSMEVSMLKKFIFSCRFGDGDLQESARILPAHPFSISFSNRIHEKSSVVQPFWFQPFICFRAVNSGSPLATRLFCLHMERIQTAWQNTTIHNMLQLWGQVFLPLHSCLQAEGPTVVSQSPPRRRSRYHCARSRPVFHTWIAMHYLSERHFDFRRDDPEQKSGPISTSPNSICLLLI